MKGKRVQRHALALIAAAFLLIVASASCSPEPRKTYRSLTSQEFTDAVDAENVQIVDVRTAAEYARGHIPGAINVDVKESEFGKRCTNRVSKGRCVAVYCRSGKRSKIAAGILSDMGYDVIELDKGIGEWKGKFEYGPDHDSETPNAQS